MLQALVLTPLKRQASVLTPLVLQASVLFTTVVVKSRLEIHAAVVRSSTSTPEAARDCSFLESLRPSTASSDMTRHSQTGGLGAPQVALSSLAMTQNGSSRELRYHARSVIPRRRVGLCHVAGIVQPIRLSLALEFSSMMHLII
jgi:hypothetical protein